MTVFRSAPERFRLARLGAGGGGRIPEQLRLIVGSGGRDETFVRHKDRYLIHPGDLILGATLEFLALPPGLKAFVEGKSKWGGLGLIVATASQVAPGFHGVVVLEFANAGTVPLELEPGTAIAQIVFQKMSQPVPATDVYRGKYYCQIKPSQGQSRGQRLFVRTARRKTFSA
jgi:deoxycytidine triphosphate deaminase